MSYCTWNNYTLTYYNWVTTYFQVFVSIIPQTSGVTDEKTFPLWFSFRTVYKPEKAKLWHTLVVTGTFRPRSTCYSRTNEGKTYNLVANYFHKLLCLS